MVNATLAFCEAFREAKFHMAVAAEQMLDESLTTLVAEIRR